MDLLHINKFYWYLHLLISGSEYSILSNGFVLPDPEPSIFLYFLVILLHLICSFHKLNLSSFHMHIFLSNLLIGFFLSSFELIDFLSKNMLLFTSNICCVFSITLLFFLNSSRSSLKLPTSILFIYFWIVSFIFSLSCFLNSFDNLEIKFCFYDKIFLCFIVFIIVVF